MSDPIKLPGNAVIGVDFRQKPSLSNDKTSQKVLNTISKSFGINDETISKLIDYKPDVMDAIFESCAWNPNQGKFYFLAPDATDLIISTSADLPQLIFERFDKPYSEDKLRDEAERLAKMTDVPSKMKARFIADVMTMPINRVMDLVKAYRQFTAMEMMVDPFSKNGKIITSDSIAFLRYSHNRFNDGGQYDEQIVQDYKQHFPELDSFINLIAASRFAASRKRSYVWLHADSDWGKTFLINCLKRFDLVVETSVSEIERIFTGQPAGKTIQEFKKAWVLAIDEFKGVKSEIKQLQNEIRFSPKGLPQVKAEIFLKIFLSAEGADSLASEESGVEDQFANRFSYYIGSGSLAERPLFMQSTENYFLNVSSYIANRLNALADEYIAMGKLQASIAAEKEIDGFYEQFRIDKTFHRLNDRIRYYATQFSNWCIENYKSGMGKSYQSERSVAEKAVSESVFLSGNKYYCQRPSAMISIWLQQDFNQAERGKLTFKTHQIAAALGKPGAVRGASYSRNDVVAKASQLIEQEDL